MATHTPEAVLCSGHEEHMAKRRELGRYGASTVATILGYNRYRSPLELWLERTGREVPEDSGPSEFAQSGQDEEPVTLMVYGRDHLPVLSGQVGEPLGLWTTRPSLTTSREVIMLHPSDELASCSPDGLVLAAHGGGVAPSSLTGLDLLDAWADARRGVDAKSVSFYVAKEWGDPGTDFIPPAYWWQGQWCCYVTGLPAWDFARRSNMQQRTFTVQADEELQAYAAEQVRLFHQCVLADEPPPFPEQAKAMARTNAAMRLAWPDTEPGDIEATEEDLRKAMQLAVVRTWQDRLQVLRDSLEAYGKDRLRDIGDAVVIPGQGPKGRGLPLWTWKPHAKEPAPRTDWRALAEALEAEVDPGLFAALMEANTKTGGLPGRPFLFKGTNLEKWERLARAAINAGLPPMRPGDLGDELDLLGEMADDQDAT